MILFPDDDTTFMVDEERQIDIPCNATGLPAPTISWYRNGVIINDPRFIFGTPDEMLGADGVYTVMRTLTLMGAQDADSDNYTCVAENGNARMPRVMQDFELIVNGKLNFNTYYCGTSEERT